MTWRWDEPTLARLQAFLAERGLAGGEPARLISIGDGHSNLTYRLEGAVLPLVLRRPPPPPLPPGSNDVLREARILSALGETGVPVPEVVAIGEADAVFDVPFYLMSFVAGEIFTTRMPGRFEAGGAVEVVARALVDMMARLHSVDWRSLGLDNLGKPEGFNARHVRRIAGLLDDDDYAAHPDFARIRTELEATCPIESGASLIHNDFRIGNVMWSLEARPRIAAVLDWELATIGDPLLDLAYLVSSMPRDGECRQPVQDFSRACLVSGFPSQAALISRYFDITGRRVIGIEWYLAMVNWKLAALYAYSCRRGDDPYYSEESHVSRFLNEANTHLNCNLPNP
jgi:aminoglycoside phosphotransferase (APT) family kinase protein